VRTLGTLLALLLLVACDSKPKGPVPINADDACASCRMAISERRYAAELVEQDGTVYKFDDIACMLRFAHAHAKEASAARFYVTDYRTGQDWIDARQSYFVKLATSVSSPMASGLVAFRSSNDAAHVSSTPLGSPVTFDQLWAQDMTAMSTNAGNTQPRR
jgi:copper chaperone NosL